MGSLQAARSLLLAIAVLVIGTSVPAQTPAQRKAILDALRDEVQQVYGKTVMFQVHRISVDGGSATAEVTAIHPKASDNAKEVPVAGIPRLRATLGLARRGVWQVSELAAISGRTSQPKPAATQPPASSTPTAAERKAILDALRIELEAEYKRPILFQVNKIRINRADREAVLTVRALQPNSNGTAGTPYRDIAPITAIVNCDTEGNWGVSEWGGPGDFSQN
jgi:hypothetical protein